MPDENGAQNTADSVAQQSGMLTENNTTGTVTTGSEPVPQGASTTSASTSALPQEASERTKREFEKLTTDLRQERTERERLQTLFNSMQSKPEDSKPNAPVMDTGVLENIQQRLNEAEQRVLQAESKANMTLEELENREVYTAHPALNPNDEKTFDKELHKKTRQIILDSMLNPEDYEGKQLSFKEAADLVSQEKSGITRSLEAETSKEQASLDASGNSARRLDVTDYDFATLQNLTRKGGKSSEEAIMQRLRNLPPED